MPETRRDIEHTPRELDAAFAKLMDVLHTTGSRSTYRGKEWDLIPQRLLLSEIDDLTARCQEMTLKERLAFQYFLTTASNSMRLRRKDSSLPHALYLGTIVAPLMLAMDSGTDIGRDTVFDVVVYALRNLKFSRDHGKGYDENELPLIRGELIYHLMTLWLPPYRHQYGYRQFYMWLHENDTRVFAVRPHLVERGTMNRRLIRQLVENVSMPLTEGVL